MHYIKKLLIVISIVFFFNSYAFALSQDGIKVGLTGMEGDGTQVYVQITPNSNRCKWSGVYFTDLKELDKALSVALSAKMSGKTIRIDFIQPGGSDTQCFGYGIYVQ